MRHCDASARPPVNKESAIHWVMAIGPHPFFYDAVAHVGKLVEKLATDARRTPPFILHYLASRRPSLASLVVLVIGAASCGIGGQYAIKMLVDAMNAGPG